MIANRTGHIVFVLLAGAAASAQAEPAVAVKTDGLPPHVAAHVAAKAQEGITALRQYVWISRGINQIDLRSLLREAQPEQVAQVRPREEEPATVAALNEQR
jgi:hypothetical protein